MASTSATPSLFQIPPIGALLEDYYGDEIGVFDLKERGWTRLMIFEFLPRHLANLPNPKYKFAADMELYAVVDVEKAEKLPMFRERHFAARCAVKKEIATKRRQTEFLASRLPAPSLPLINASALNDVARWYYCQRFDIDADCETSLQPGGYALNVVAVKCLLQYDGCLEANLAAISGLVGAKEIGFQMKREILGRASKAFPELLSDCEYCEDMAALKLRGYRSYPHNYPYVQVAFSLGDKDNLIRTAFELNMHHRKCA